MTSTAPCSASSVADVAESLMDQFARSISPATVSGIVLAAQRDLVGQVPVGALPELIHRLAEERLSHL